MQTKPIEWSLIFKQAGIAPRSARIIKTKLAGWTLDIGDPSQMIAIDPPTLNNKQPVSISNDGWEYEKKSSHE